LLVVRKCETLLVIKEFCTRLKCKLNNFLWMLCLCWESYHFHSGLLLECFLASWWLHQWEYGGMPVLLSFVYLFVASMIVIYSMSVKCVSIFQKYTFKGNNECISHIKWLM
jgi:hypothetical protein